MKFFNSLLVFPKELIKEYLKQAEEKSSKKETLSQKISSYLVTILLITLILEVTVNLVIKELLPIAPIEIADFVVDSKGFLYISSPYNGIIYKYSPAGKIVNKFETGARRYDLLLAIDQNNHFYMSGRNFVTQFTSNGKKCQLYSSISDEIKSFVWFLYDEDSLVNDPSKVDILLDWTTRKRRPVKIGEVMFSFAGSGKNRASYLSDPFYDSNGNKYVCKGWWRGIYKIDKLGNEKRIVHPPLLLLPFICPFPGMYLLFGSGIILLLFSFLKVGNANTKNRKNSGS